MTYTNLEKAVYGVAAPDVQQLFLSYRSSMSERILRVVQSVINGTELTNIEAIAAWRAAMEAEFAEEVDWPEDYSEPPTTKSKTIRHIINGLEDLNVSQTELDSLEIYLNNIVIPEEEI